MSALPKRHPKINKASSTVPTAEDDAPPASKSSPAVSSSAPRIDAPEAQDRLRTRASSDTSELESPRSMVAGIIDVISTRVQTQLNAFLATEVSALIAATKTEISASLEAHVTEMRTHQQQEIADLKKELEALKLLTEKQAKWQAVEKDLLADVLKQQGEYIVLNVGGVEYPTSRSTLVKHPNSMLGAMFSGRYQPITDPNGRFFIDRDGKLFKYILNFLRTGSTVGVDETDVPLMTELLGEATFYQIEPLVQLLSTSLNMAESEDVALAHYRSRGHHHSSTSAHNTSSKLDGHSALDSPSSSASTSQASSSSSGNNKLAAVATMAAARHNLAHAHSSKQLLRTMSTLFSRRIAFGPLEGPVYSREEIHLLKLKHAAGMNAKTTRLNLAGLDLRGVDLSKLDLHGIDFSRCNLEGACFESANLLNCSFAEANLKRANFQQASFGNSDLECPDFTDADLQGANFTRFRGLLFRSRFEGVEDEMIGMELRWLR